MRGASAMAEDSLRGVAANARTWWTAPINGLPSKWVTRLGVIFTLLVQGVLTLFTAGRGPTL